MSSSELVQTIAQPGSGTAYAELRRTVVSAGLLKRAYGYYCIRILMSYMLLIITSLIPLVLVTYDWSVVEAILLGFAIVQVALVGHDAGHLAVFRGARANWILGQICWSLCSGVGFWYWCDRHNKHHGHTNDIEGDPDLQPNFLLAYVLLLFKFASKRLSTFRNRPVYTDQNKFLLRLTLVFYLILRVLVFYFGFKIDGWLFTIRSLRGSRRLLELVLLSLNSLLWITVIILAGWRGFALFIGSHLIASLYLGLIVAPNHKGMPVWAKGTKLSFLERQVLSSRNVTSHPVWDFLYGGLNYQIEHHLFPTMPRVHFSRARSIVKPFCIKCGLPYEELNPWSSYREAFVGLSSGKNMLS